MRLFHRPADAYVDRPIDRTASDRLASLTDALLSRSVHTTLQASEVMRLAVARRAELASRMTEDEDGRG